LQKLRLSTSIASNQTISSTIAQFERGVQNEFASWETRGKKD
jgi:hypothetical protein